MLDFTMAMAPHTYQVWEAERRQDAERHKWRRIWRAAVRAERAARREPRTVVITSPAHLAGPHKL